MRRKKTKMKLKSNFHIHSTHSCDSARATILNIIKEMSELGFEEFGLTDHFHTAYNLPDIVSARRDFLASRPPKNPPMAPVPIIEYRSMVFYSSAVLRMVPKMANM